MVGFRPWHHMYVILICITSYRIEGQLAPPKKGALSHAPTPAETGLANELRASPGRDPVVVLNGLGGAQLKFRLRGAESPHRYCRTWYARWHTAWLLPRVIIPPIARCLIDFITPEYNAANGTFGSKIGVEVKVKGFGQIVSLENLGPTIPLAQFDYIRGFVKFMVTELGYRTGIDLFGAPYDWRYTPDVLKAQGYFANLKALIESVYVTAGNRRVHLLGHSLGGLQSLAFLNDMDMEWKRKYIKSYIPVGGPFGGTVVNLLGTISGYNLGLPIKPALLRDFEAIAPTGTWLFPRKQLWPASEVLVETPCKNYTTADYPEMLTDLGFGVPVDVFYHTQPLYLDTLVPPGIDVHVVHSELQPTIVRLKYNQTFHKNDSIVPEGPEKIYGYGDGTVPERSLLRPIEEWKAVEGSWVMTHHTMTGVDHMDIMNYRAFFRVLTEILTDHVERTPSPADDIRGVPDRLRKRVNQVYNPMRNGINNIREQMDFGPFDGT